MKKILMQRIQIGFVCLASLFVMILFSACAGVAGVTSTGTGSSTTTITGSIQSVNTTNHTVTLNVNGQQFTIGGLSDQQIAAIQSQVGKTYSIQVVQNGTSYTINSGTDPQEDVNGTPGVSTPESNGQSQQGSIQFVGKVQSANGSTLVVSLPNGQNITMNVVNGQTDLTDMNGAQPTVGQIVKVTVNANTDGSFTAEKVGIADSGDQASQNTVEYQGVTSSAVGSDNMIHFVVGNQTLSFQIGSGADLGDFNDSAQSIPANQAVKVTVVFNGSTGSVTKVSNASN